MPFFFNLKNKLVKKTYLKSLRLQTHVMSWSKMFFLLKFNSRHSHRVPKLQSWAYQSLYINKRHYKQRVISKKMVLLHLFWTLDVWKLSHPFQFLGTSTSFPIRFNSSITAPLDVFSAFHKWVYLQGFNKNKAVPYSITNSWSQMKPLLWMSKDYHNYAHWYLKNKKFYQYRRDNKRLWFLNTWYLENGSSHKMQERFYCNVPEQYPVSYTRTLWLRLMQYPCVYNYQWLPLLRLLALYGNRTLLPWDLTYTSQQTWMFDYKASGLVTLLKALVKQRNQITEYILVKRWKDLLSGKDLMSRSFQIFIRTSTFFRQYLKFLNQSV